MSEAVTAVQQPAQEDLGFGQDLIGWYRAHDITVEHPVMKLPSPQQVRALLAGGSVGQAQLMAVLQKREKTIQLMESDPLRHGWKPKMWQDLRRLVLSGRREICVMGGNRSTKTEGAAEYAVDDLVKKGGRIWGFLHSTEDSSKRLQHPRVYKYLPSEWRVQRRSATTFVSYSEQRGFSDNTFILPNGSRGFFFNYKQDPAVLEGYEFDGWWADELIPPEFLVALRYRALTRWGVGLLTFTPVKGYTPVVGDYLAAAKVAEHLPSELLPGENVKGVPAGRMPYIMECVHPNRAVIFYFTEFNLYNPYAAMKKELATESTSKIKMRAYGYPDRMAGNVFPKFGNHNIVKKERVWQMMRDYPGTIYHYCDFAWARNWFMLWLWVSEYKGRKIVLVFMEWPNFEQLGEWVVPSKKPDGDRGPAQQPLGHGFAEYKRMILEMEKNFARRLAKIADSQSPIAEGGGAADPASARLAQNPDADGTLEIFERRCDPRSGAAEALSADEGGSSIIYEMEKEHRSSEGHPLGPMIFIPAHSGRDIDTGIEKIKDWMDYDEGRAIGAGNEPVFYVSEECRNLIDCLRMWTGVDGQKGAAKDPIDLLRYAAKDDVGYVDPSVMGSEGGGSY